MIKKYNIKNRSALNLKSEEVGPDEDVSVLIGLMKKVLVESQGIGLAANQIGIPKRVIIINTPGIKQVIINPSIKSRKLGPTTSEEGCLSFPGLTKKMQRYKLVNIEGFDHKWNPVKLRLRGVDAFCAQHEVDHLNGITIKNKYKFL